MNKTVLLILTVALASLTIGCSKKEPDEVVVKPTPVKIDTPINQANPTEAGQLSNLSTEKKSEPVQKVATLIPATNPDVRVRTVVRGRQDPFSVVPLVPQIKVEKKEEVEVKQPTPKAVTSENRPNSRATSQTVTRELPQEPVEVEIFEPTLAQNVIVSGLYEANGRTQLIVQAPDESSRYVDIGERIANGQVLVKAVDKNSSTPSVTLEESGVTVIKKIGEIPEQANI